MTGDELERLVQLVVAGDGRTTGTADALVWAGVVGDLHFDDAQAAVLAHFRAGTGRWLEPGMVRRAVLDLRRDRLERAADAPPEGVDPDDVPAYLAALRSRARAIADGTLVPPALPAPDRVGVHALHAALRPVFQDVE